MNINKLLNNKYIKLLIGFVLLTVLIIVIVMILRLNNKNYKYEIRDEKIYTYIGEKKYEYNSKVTVDAKGNVSKIKSKDAQLEISS